MPLQKQPVNVNFSQGVQTKMDPWQLPTGMFLSLNNVTFAKNNLLTKRNGFGALPNLPDDTSTTLATYQTNLVALGTSLNVLSADNSTWYNRGAYQPLELSVLPAVRASTSQSAPDIAIAPNGLACAVFVDAVKGAAYQIFDSNTGQIIVSFTTLESTAAQPRVFILASNFIITYLATGGGTSIRRLAIPVNTPTHPGAAVTLSSQVASLTAGYDGVVANNNLYLAWAGSDSGGSVRQTYIDSFLVQHGVKVTAGYTPHLVSVVADTSASTAVIWTTFYQASNTTTYSMALNQGYTASSGSILTPSVVLASTPLTSLTSYAANQLCQVFFDVTNTYTSPGDVAQSDYIERNTITQAGTVGTAAVIIRSVGLASKAFYMAATGLTYFLAAYAGAYQPTYFLIDQAGNIVAKLAYNNGGGYSAQVLPSANVVGDEVQIAYLYKDLVQAVNTTLGAPNVAGIYTQTGVNLASFTFQSSQIASAEIGNDLHLTGGFPWMYDGNKPVEHQFHVWPEDITAATSTAGGSMTAQQYYYQVTYEWTDAQGNTHVSSPSIALSVTTTGSTSSVTLTIPTLRLTAKTGSNPARIVVYRWSVGQQEFYRIFPPTTVYANVTTQDTVTIVDTASDTSIQGNQLLYTTGGVVEDIAGPACSAFTLFKSRLILVDSEDPNLLWYSKQVIEGTPVEFSDLFTIYVAPTTGAQGSTGNITAISAMDDKLIVFKPDAAYYITGTGPDNTGANNDFSDPTFISSTVGCLNAHSVVLTPTGIMFQSDKGIWQLGRDLSTTYIGAPVEAYTTGANVVSALAIPGTNEVRFTLDSGITLLYDYYSNQWGTFTGIPGISSILYQSLHAYLNDSGQVYQETPGVYLDGATPVTMSLKTSWYNLAGLQGFQSVYFFYILGQYLSPHKLQVGVSYDYNPNPTQTSTISPDNYNGTLGSDTLFGGSTPFGGNSQVEQWRVFLSTHKCEALQVTITEQYDPSYGAAAGAGLTLSGLNFVVGIKKGYTTLRPSRSVG